MLRMGLRGPLRPAPKAIAPQPLNFEKLRRLLNALLYGRLRSHVFFTLAPYVFFDRQSGTSRT